MAIITTDLITKLFTSARSGLKSGIDHMTFMKGHIDTAHYMIHQGVHFFDVRSAVVGNGSNFYHLIKTPAFGSANVACHWEYDVQYTLTCDLEIYEGVTGTDPADTPLNSCRFSTTTSECLCDDATSGYTGGTLLEKFLLGSTTASPRAIGNSVARDDEIILKPSTIYAIKITSNAAGNRIATRMLWYEAGSNVYGV